MNESGEKKEPVWSLPVDDHFDNIDEDVELLMITFTCPQCGNEIKLEHVYEVVLCPACEVEMYRNGQ